MADLKPAAGGRLVVFGGISLDTMVRVLRRLRFSGQVDKLRLTGPERHETWV
jgi:hypothetical protein